MNPSFPKENIGLKIMKEIVFEKNSMNEIEEMDNYPFWIKNTKIIKTFG